MPQSNGDLWQDLWIFCCSPYSKIASHQTVEAEVSGRDCLLVPCRNRSWKSTVVLYRAMSRES